MLSSTARIRNFELYSGVKAGHDCIFWPTQPLAEKDARTAPEVILKWCSFAFFSSKTSIFFGEENNFFSHSRARA